MVVLSSNNIEKPEIFTVLLILLFKTFDLTEYNLLI